MATNGVGKANGAPSSNAAKYNLPSHFIGGNHLGVAPQSKVKDFVQAHGGHTVITNVRVHSCNPMHWSDFHNIWKLGCVCVGVKWFNR
jgi:hypothetical protein